MPLAPYTGYVPLSKTSLSCKVEELQIMQSDKRTFGFPLCTIFCAIPLIKDYEVYRSAISERLFNAIKGDVVVLEDIGDVVKGKQINGEFLSESGKYYVMNGGIVLLYKYQNETRIIIYAMYYQLVIAKDL